MTASLTNPCLDCVSLRNEAPMSCCKIARVSSFGRRALCRRGLIPLLAFGLQSHLQRFVCKSSNLRRQAAGRDSNVSRSDADSPWRINDPNGPHHVLEVRKRFAHSHENDVVDLFPACALNRDDLIDNFVRLQIPREPFQTARAKCFRGSFLSASTLEYDGCVTLFDR
jgi:hypothetical protein